MPAKALAISGFKNSGKTTLIERLIPLLQADGIITAVIKHEGHSFVPDAPGTDSCRFFAAGACASIVFDSEKYQLSRRTPVCVADLIAMLPETDLVLMEGFKNTDFPKIELVRRAISTRPVCDPDTCIAYVSDLQLDVDKPVFHPDDVEGIKACIEAFMQLG